MPSNYPPTEFDPRQESGTEKRFMALFIKIKERAR